MIGVLRKRLWPWSQRSKLWLKFSHVMPAEGVSLSWPLRYRSLCVCVCVCVSHFRNQDGSRSTNQQASQMHTSWTARYIHNKTSTRKNPIYIIKLSHLCFSSICGNRLTRTVQLSSFTVDEQINWTPTLKYLTRSKFFKVMKHAPFYPLPIIWQISLNWVIKPVIEDNKQVLVQSLEKKGGER